MPRPHRPRSKPGTATSYLPEHIDGTEPPVTVHYRWTDREPTTWSDPGCDAAIEITEVLLAGRDIWPQHCDDPVCDEVWRTAAWDDMDCYLESWEEARYGG